MGINNFVFNKILWFSFLHEIGSYHRNNSSYLLWVTQNYVKKSYSCIAAVSEDP